MTWQNGRQQRLTHRAIHPSPIPKAVKKPVTACLPHEANSLLQRPKLSHDDADLFLLRRHLFLLRRSSAPAGRHLFLLVAGRPCLDDLRRAARSASYLVGAEGIDLFP